MEWKCEFQGCPSTPKQIEELRKQNDEDFDGFTHFENHSMRVCNLCRQTPLDQQKEGAGLEPIFIQALQEELKGLESSKDDLAAVFRYYRRYAKELIAMLHTTVQECFAWEIVPILELVDDLLLYERVSRQRGGFSTEVEEIVGSMISTAWKKIEDRDRKKVAILLRTWRELKVFSSPEILVDIEARIRSISINSGENSSGLTSGVILESVDKWMEESDDEGDKSLVLVKGKEPQAKEAPWKRRKKEENGSKIASKTPAQVLERILKAGADPFDILDLDPKGLTTKLVRKQYRKLCLFIHPDKNPNMDVDKCQDALSRVQKAREEAEARLEAPNKGRRTGDVSASATMCATSEDRIECRLEGCNEPPCRQCANSCCVRNITHCHQLQHQPGGKKCFFHPPPRSHARNA